MNWLKQKRYILVLCILIIAGEYYFHRNDAALKDAVECGFVSILGDILSDNEN